MTEEERILSTMLMMAALAVLMAVVLGRKKN
jgi:hypothetical protein